MGAFDDFGDAGGWLGGALGQQMTMDIAKEIGDRVQERRKAARDINYDGLKGTAFDGISTDPRMRDAQMQALRAMQSQAQSGGMDPQSRAMQAQAQNEAAGYEMAQRQANQQALAARGMGGSGADVASLNAAQQGGANRSSAAATQAAAAGAQRAAAANAGVGQLGGQMHAQDYSEAAQRATAKDRSAQNVFAAQMAKYGATNAAEQQEIQRLAAVRNETIATMRSGGEVAGKLTGDAAQAGASGMGGGGGGGGGGMGGMAGMAGGMGGGGGNARKGDATSVPEGWQNPYGKWGSY